LKATKGWPEPKFRFSTKQQINFLQHFEFAAAARSSERAVKIKSNFRADRSSPLSRDLLGPPPPPPPPRRHSYRGVLRLCELRGESLYIAMTNEAKRAARERARARALAR